MGVVCQGSWGELVGRDLGTREVWEFGSLGVLGCVVFHVRMGSTDDA